jgi:thiamine biosynthesis lipoprotein
MGTDAHVLVVGDPDTEALAEWAQTRLETLEARWSRFRADSELSALNGARGQHRIVSADTVRVLMEAVAAWRSTEGRFDPTVGAAIVASGYDRSFATLADRHLLPDPTGVEPSPGCAAIEIDRSTGLVRLPLGVQLDLGGIAKGTAADLVATELLDRGAVGACVNVGGDLRVVGENPSPDGWVIELAPPGSANRRPIGLRAGGVATSSTKERRWATADGDRHHVIDPRSGRPANSGLVSVSVVAGGAAQAEVVATTVLVDGATAGRQLVDELGLAALMVREDGTVSTAGRLGAFWP